MAHQRILILFLPLTLYACTESEINCALGDETFCEDDGYYPPTFPTNEYPQIDMDENGNAVTVWRSNTKLTPTQTRNHVVASIYSPINGWGSARRIDVDNDEWRSLPKMAMSSSGTAIVIWNQLGNIFLNHYTPYSGWRGAYVIQANENSCVFITEIAMNDSDHAIAIWKCKGDSSVRTAQFTPNTGWSAVESIDTDLEEYNYSASIAMNSIGNAVTVWEKRDYTRGINDTWATRYTPGTGWQNAERIENSPDSGAVPKAAIDTEGNIVVVWGGDSVQTNRYTPSFGWGLAEPIQNPDITGGYLTPELASNPSGHAISVWEQLGNIWANYYSPETGWGTAHNVESSDYPADEPKVAIDDAGNALVVWQQNNLSNTQIWSIPYKVDSGWGTAQQISALNAIYTTQPNVAMDNDGNIVAVWVQSDSDSSKITEIWSNHYSVATGWGSATLVSK